MTFLRRRNVTSRLRPPAPVCYFVPPMVDLDTIVSLCKRRGFIFQSSEIYGGLGSAWDYGPLGVELKRNVKNLWWRENIQSRDDMVGLDAAITMHPADHFRHAMVLRRTTGSDLARARRSGPAI